MDNEKSQMEKGGGGFASLFARPGLPWIPVGAQMHDHAMTVAGVPAKKFYYDARTLVETTVKVVNYYEMDTILPFADVYNYEIEAMGGKMIYGEDSMPTIDFRDPLIKDPEDLRKLKEKEVDWRKDGRLPYALESINISEEFGQVQGMFCGPFSMAVGMRGYPALIKDMRKRPEFAHELFTFIVDDVLNPYLKVQNEETGILMATGADAWACVPNLSVKDMKEWVVPYNQRLTEKTKKFGVMGLVISGDYCEERPEKFDVEVVYGCFDIIIASQGAPSIFLGMGRWHDYPLKPVLDYAAKYREQGINIPIMAGLNARLLRDGPVEKIVSTIKRYIDTFGHDYELIIFLTNIPADTPPSHVHAAVAAIHTYGRYPIADNLDDIEFKLPKRESFQEWEKKEDKGAT